VKGALLDLDGVLYDADTAVAGAADAVSWLRERRVPLLFVTNTTSRPRPALVEKLAGFGIAATEPELWTAPVAAADWLRARAPSAVALFVREAVRAEFDGLPLLPDDAEAGASHVVVGDLLEGWDWATLNRAFRLLHADLAAALVALGMTRYWKGASGIQLDAGPFVALLRFATGREPVVLGKPAAPFFRAAAARLGLAPRDVLMVGDDIAADVGGAQAAGLRGALVRTGKFRDADLAGAVRPDAVLASIADLPAWWDRRA